MPQKIRQAGTDHKSVFTNPDTIGRHNLTNLNSTSNLAQTLGNFMNKTIKAPEPFWGKTRRAAMAVPLIGTFLAMASGAASAADLPKDDFVGISFWIISASMVAATVFFFLERDRVEAKWKTSLTVTGLVTLVAAIHYFYMRDVWVSTGETPTVFRYIDWVITVPLQMIEFYLILAAVTTVSVAIFWRLLVGTLVMLIGGYLGEAGYLAVWPAFIIGMAGWAFILYEIFLGEASKVSASSAPPPVKTAFNTLRLIVSVGWSIYPIGYFAGYLMGGVPADTANALNIIYNFADFVNKIAFGVIIWVVAVQMTELNKAKAAEAGKLAKA
jgi:bacteriorhodopsin